MHWKPIVVGVDDSPEALRAVHLANTIAHASGVPYHLVHAARDVFIPANTPGNLSELGPLSQAVLRRARQRLADMFEGEVPPAVLESMEVRLGRSAAVIRDVVAERDVELVVLGGKHHQAATRWAAGSTVQNVVRTTNVPVLIARQATKRITRILAAVDLSDAAYATIAEASKFAQLFGSELKILHIVEPLPLVGSPTKALNESDYHKLSQARFHEITSRAPQRRTSLPGHPDESTNEIWRPEPPRKGGRQPIQKLRTGRALEIIGDEVLGWDADLLVVGSHGKGWVDRVLIGSTTERLLDNIPTSMLVVPIAEPQKRIAPLHAEVESGQLSEVSS